MCLETSPYNGFSGFIKNHPKRSLHNARYVENEETQRYQKIPTSFNSEAPGIYFPNLPTEARCGPRRKRDWRTIINYILLLLYTGCQWKTLPIAKDAKGKPEIHYSNQRTGGNAPRRAAFGSTADVIP
jgi:hypothetical protein